MYTIYREKPTEKCEGPGDEKTVMWLDFMQQKLGNTVYISSVLFQKLKILKVK